MVRPVRKLAPPNSMAAGQPAIINCPLGLTYETFYIHLNVDVAGTATDVPHNAWGTYLGEIRLMVDGDAKYTMDAADIAATNKRYGQSLQPGVLPIFLVRPWMQTIQGQDQTGYGTMGGINSFTLEMDIKDGVTVNSLSVHAQQSAGQPFGPHLAVRKYSISHGVIGKQEVSDIRRANYSLIAMHLASDDIGEIEVIVNTRELLKTTPEIRAAHEAVFKRNPQTGYTSIDFAMDRLADALPMNVQDFRLGLDFTSTGNTVLYTEAIEPA